MSTRATLLLLLAVAAPLRADTIQLGEADALLCPRSRLCTLTLPHGAISTTASSDTLNWAVEAIDRPTGYPVLLIKPGPDAGTADLFVATPTHHYTITLVATSAPAGPRDYTITPKTPPSIDAAVWTTPAPPVCEETPFNFATLDFAYRITAKGRPNFRPSRIFTAQGKTWLYLELPMGEPLPALFELEGKTLATVNYRPTPAPNRGLYLVADRVIHTGQLKLGKRTVTFSLQSKSKEETR